MPSPSSASPKLLFYSDSRYYSGAEKVFALLIEGLAQDYPGSLVVLAPELKDSIPNWEKLPLIWDFSALQLKLRLWEIWRLKKLIRAHQIDLALINMWSPFANTLALIAAQQTKIPIVPIFHYFQPKSNLTGPLAFLKLAAYTWVAKKSHTIVTLSYAHQKVLVEEFGFPEKKIQVIHNRLAPNGHTGRVKKSSSSLKLLCVGSLEPDKGQAYLLPLLAEVKGDWQLSIVGDGPERPLLEKLIAEHNLANVSLLGRRTDMDSIYGEHDILLHPSFLENLSMAIIEAMAHGLPVMAHTIGGNQELISEKEGWLIPLKDDAAWIQTLTNVLANPDLEHHSAQAIQKWEQEFQLDQSLVQYRELISKALGSKP